MAATYKPHVVRQGEHVAKLAFLRGATAEDVWDHPTNADLRAKRESMDVLYPGDVIHLPDGEREPVPFEKGSTNRFTAEIPKRTLKLALASTEGPYANEPYEVQGLPTRPGVPPPKGTTGAKGEVELTVPITLRELGLFLPNPNFVYLVRIGDVDPMAEPAGPQKRLENLGLLERGAEHDPESVESAIRAFQVKNGLPVTGSMDTATQEKLTSVSGQAG